MRTAFESLWIHGGCAGAATNVTPKGAPIVPRDSVFTRSTSEVVRMFPLRLIFPPWPDDEVAHGDQSRHPVRGGPQKGKLALEPAVERGNPLLHAGSGHHRSIVVASIFSVKLSATRTPLLGVNSGDSPGSQRSWRFGPDRPTGETTGKIAEKMRGTEGKTPETQASLTKAARS